MMKECVSKKRVELLGRVFYKLHASRSHLEKMDGRVNGIIEVSRSIGDGQFKTHGVTCIPDMKKLTITPNDRFVRRM
ncbi:hypothetical protein ANCCAN_18263 [Ancylostoma caninum]|uniref:PPM-type phosphatase domain-containing protein n=1 Tax=Ancylostoma caninum TaxID=29170 RepID=A0A368FUU3_ANCCA|nr:hypothetical protein ANCCAN_18263 [Ancylostoma caninum]